MKDPEKIYLTSKEKRLLRYIGKHGLQDDDKRTKTPQFDRLTYYGMLMAYVDERFPPKYVTGTNLKDCNAYKPVQDVEQYWRHWEEQRRLSRGSLLRDAFLLALGSLITLFTQNIGGIINFITGLFEKG